MKIIVNELGFKLAPHREGLCYELHAWKSERELTSGRYAGEVAPAGWVGLGTYPSDIPQGLEAMIERASSVDSAVLRCARAAIREMRSDQLSVLETSWAGPLETGIPLHVMELGYRITAHAEGRCFQISRWRPSRTVQKGVHSGLRAAAGWVSLGMYPTSVARGMAKVLDLAMNADPQIVGIEEAAHIYRAASRSILRANSAAALEVGRCA